MLHRQRRGASATWQTWMVLVATQRPWTDGAALLALPTQYVLILKVQGLVRGLVRKGLEKGGGIPVYQAHCVGWHPFLWGRSLPGIPHQVSMPGQKGQVGVQGQVEVLQLFEAQGQVEVQQGLVEVQSDRWLLLAQASSV